jgi:thiamine monophosphate synthase
VNQYLKAISMVLAAAGGAAVAALADNHLSQPEAVNIIIAVFGAAAIFTAPNIPGHEYVKWTLAAGTAAATALATVIGTGGVGAVSVSEWIQVGLAIVAAVVAIADPNVTTTQRQAALRT